MALRTNFSDLARLLISGLALGMCLPMDASDSWLYQLQGPDPQKILQSGFSKVIIDYSRDGTGEKALRSGEVKALKAGGITPLCYFSIGEAEDYRFYWKPEWAAAPPDWLGRENPEWKGNYEVRYWHPKWREGVLRPYLERIVEQEFEGVYLDIVDGFEYWGDEDNFRPGKETRRPDDPRDEAEAARRMVDLLEWINRTGMQLRKGRPFLVVAQNAERLLTFENPEKFLTAISGLGVESLWFNKKKHQPARLVAERLDLLRKAQAAGKIVIVTDYIDDGRGLRDDNAVRAHEFMSLCRKEGFDYYVARQNQQLDTINRIEGIQP